MFKLFMLIVFFTPLAKAMEAHDLMQAAELNKNQSSSVVDVCSQCKNPRGTLIDIEDHPKDVYRRKFHAAADDFFDKICDEHTHQSKALQDLLTDFEDLTFKIRPKLIDDHQSLTRSSYPVTFYDQEESKK